MHSLIEKAFIFKNNKELVDLQGCRYDDSLGAWLLINNGEYLVKSNFEDRPRPQTKKQDLETGEDLKSE